MLSQEIIITEDDLHLFMYGVISNALGSHYNTVIESIRVYKKYRQYFDKTDVKAFAKQISNSAYGYGDRQCRAAWGVFVKMLKDDCDDIKAKRLIDIINGHINTLKGAT